MIKCIPAAPVSSPFSAAALFAAKDQSSNYKVLAMRGDMSRERIAHGCTQAIATAIEDWVTELGGVACVHHKVRV